MSVLAYVLSGAAIVVMAVNIWLVVSLLSRYKGRGKVVARMRLLLALIAFFFAGYVISPFLVALELPHIWLVILVFAVFIFGALYVTITLSVLRKIFSLLDLLKKKS
jgi:hypothetical protein